MVVASIDFGVDPAHPAFRRADGSTRILAFWDQRAKGGRGAGNRWGYGRIFTPEEIDEALAEEDPYSLSATIRPIRTRRTLPARGSGPTARTCSISPRGTAWAAG